MKQFFLYIIILVGLAQTLQADNVTNAGCIRMAGHNVTRTDSLILVDITFDLSSLELRSNRSILCTPPPAPGRQPRETAPVRGQRT